MKSVRNARFSVRKLLKTTARILDLAVFGALLAASAALLVSKPRNRTGLFLLILGACIPLLLILERRKAVRAEREERIRTENELRLEKILLMPDAEIAAALGETRIAWLRTERPGKMEILDAVRRRPRILICPGNTSEAETLLRRCAPEIRLIGRDELLRTVAPPCSGEEIEARRTEKRQARKTDRTWLIRSLPVNRYLWLGTLLLVLSFVSGYKIYYRAISSICLIFAVIRGVFDHQKVEKIFRFFLDNMDR